MMMMTMMWWMLLLFDCSRKKLLLLQLHAHRTRAHIGVVSVWRILKCVFEKWKTCLVPIHFSHEPCIPENMESRKIKTSRSMFALPDGVQGWKCEQSLSMLKKYTSPATVIVDEVTASFFFNHFSCTTFFVSLFTWIVPWVNFVCLRDARWRVI